MGSDVLRRVRWANVALACAVLAALVGVVVWPLVTTTAPSLPPDVPRPLVTGEPAPAAEQRGRRSTKRPRKAEPRDRAPAAARQRRAEKRAKARTRKARERRGREDGEAGTRREARSRGEGASDRPRGKGGRPAAPPRAVPRRAAPRPGDARNEFGFEG